MTPVSPDDVDDVSTWHFAVGGLETQAAVLPLGGPIQLRRLREFPTDERLALSLTSLPVAGAMALYGGKVIGHELVIDAARFEEKPELLFPTATAVLAGFRIRTRAEIVCPAVSEHSWSALPANPPNRCRAYHFERGLSHHASAIPKLVLPDDLVWVRDNLGTVIRLTANERFHTAVEALCTYMLAANDRMKVAQLWAGVEAVFDVQYELQYRLSTLTARLLAPPGAACRELYREMKALYGQRSKMVHGKKVSEEKIRAHIVAVRGRLADILTKLIELGQVPAGEDFEEMLFEK